MNRTLRIVLIALAAIELQLLFPFAKPWAAAQGPSAQKTKAVRVGLIPDPPFHERDEKGQYLNCDFRVENQPKTKLVVPLRGRFLVYDGHDYYSHHRRIDLSSPAIKRLGLTFNPVRYAYDFSPVDEIRYLHQGDPGKPENWTAYNAPLYAPAAGRVVSVANDVPDNRIVRDGLIHTGEFLER